MKRFFKSSLVLLAVTTLVAAPTVSFAHTSHSPKHAHGAITGIASWYGPGFNGRATANGERYDMLGLTAAHKTLPFGTKVRVTNLKNGNSVIVRINDRGPYIGQRLIDLSKTAANNIGLLATGTAMVTLDIVG
jgi:rare lipoprotein A